jgi:hypothetical protein
MIALLLVLLLLVPSVSTAADALVVFGPIDADPKMKDQAMNQAERAFGVNATQAMQVNLIPQASPEALNLYGPSEVVRCPSQPLPVAELRASTRRGMGQVDELEYDAATTTLETSWRDLPCSDGFLDAQEIADLTMTLGILAHYEGKKREASAWFKRTLAVRPDQPWNNAYPPDAQQLFNSALSEVLRAGDATVSVQPDPSAITEVRVDGATIDPIANVTQVKPGQHLIQWRTPAGRIQSISVISESKQNTVLLSERGLHEAILAGSAAKESLPAVIERLTALAEAKGVDEIVVVSGGSNAYRFRPTDATFESAAIQGGGKGSGKRSGKPSMTATVLLAAGGGVGVAGGAMAVASFLRGRNVLAEYEETADLALQQQYKGLRTQNMAGMAVAGVGGAVLAAGAVLMALRPSAKTVKAARTEVRLAGAPTRDGGWVALSLKF